MQKTVLGNPTSLLDQFLVHDRDLSGRAPKLMKPNFSQNRKPSMNVGGTGAAATSRSKEDAAGKAQVSYNTASYLASRHGLKAMDSQIEALNAALGKLTAGIVD